MVQRISPFVETKFGWDFGESGWNLGMDENLLKFSYLFDRNIDGVVSSLPTSPINGSAYYLTTDKRIYYRVANSWQSTPIPLWFQLTDRATGVVYKFNGTTLVAATGVNSVAGRGGDVVLTPADVGLGSVNSQLQVSVRTVDTIADLRLLSAANSTRVRTLGYYTKNGVGGSEFYYDPSDTTSLDNGGTVIVGLGGARWKAVVSDVIHCETFGTKCDGSTDDSNAFDKVIAYAMTREHSVITWKGQMRLTREHQVTITGIQSIIFKGYGSDLSQLLFTGGGNGLIVRAAVAGAWWLDITPAPRTGFSGMSIVTRNLTTGTGLLIDLKGIVGRPQRSLLFDDVIFRGHQSFEHTWAVGLALNNTGQAWFNNCRWIMGGPGQTTATGITISAVEGNDAAAYYFSHCEHLYGAAWISATDHIEGIYLTQCASGGSNRAMSWVCTSSPESGLHVVGGHYNNFIGSFYLDGVYHFEIVGCLFFHSETTPSNIIDIRNGGSYTITSNQFVGGPGVTNAITVQNSPNGDFGSVIDSNNFSDLGGTAIFLTPTSGHVTVGSGNAYNNCAAGLVDSGTTNRVHSRKWSTVFNLPLVGGVTSQNVNITVPTGFFNAAPEAADLQGLADWTIGFYNRAASTATNLSFSVRYLSGATMVAKTTEVYITATSKQ
ncbi:MAG: hypothetical protein EOO06_01150 [Chitinophagaceae bacterium]|nr:MAG: hypothetical protein EOO06_01150 [Chitinophagaceae bacterium]